MSRPGQIEYLGLVAGDEYLAERGTRSRIPRSEIESIDFRYGSAAQHPVLMFLFGVVALAAGLYPLRRIVQWLQGGVLLDLEVTLVAFLVLGGYALYEAVQRVPILVVRTIRGTKRLAFSGPVKQDELKEFLRRLETELAYPVRRSPQSLT